MIPLSLSGTVPKKSDVPSTFSCHSSLFLINLLCWKTITLIKSEGLAESQNYTFERESLTIIKQTWSYHAAIEYLEAIQRQLSVRFLQPELVISNWERI